MKNFQKLLRENVKPLLIAGLIAACLDTLFYLLYCYVWFEPIYIQASNGGFIIGLSTLGLGLLMLMAYFGAFDTFSYGVGYLGRMFFDYKNKPKFKDLVEYRDFKNNKRSNACPYYFAFICVGILVVIVALIFQFLYQVQIANIG